MKLNKKNLKVSSRKRIHYRIRNKISGTTNVPRVSIFKSNSHFYVQIIDDSNSKTIISSSTQQLKLKSNNIDNVLKVALDLSKKAKSKKIKKVVFDRSGYIYHGKIKAFADKLRQEGLEF